MNVLLRRCARCREKAPYDGVEHPTIVALVQGLVRSWLLKALEPGDDGAGAESSPSMGNAAVAQQELAGVFGGDG